MKQDGSSVTGRRIRRLRMLLLVLVLAFSTTIGLLHQVLKFGRAPVGVDALCPFGAIESAYTLIAAGRLIQRIEISSFVLMAAVLVTAILFRRAFCGYICPLGALQELFARLGRRLFKRRFTMPALIDRPARGLKYGVLLVTVVFSARTSELVIRPYDPWAAYHHIFSGELLLEFFWGTVILGLTLIGAVFFDRVFCKYLCPMGAFLALLSPLSWMKIRRNPHTCIGCRMCDKVCPVDLKVSTQTLVASPECIDCAECVNYCPVADTLYIGAAGKRRVSSGLALGLVALIFVLSVGITSATRTFQWTTIPLTQQVADPGSFDPDLIRGKMTLRDVIDGSGVPAEVFIERFGVDESDLGVPMKTLKNKRGFDTEDVRDFLKEHRN